MSKITYASAVACIIYVIACTRLDISQLVSVVNRYMTNRGKRHWKVVKWMMRYLKGAFDVGLTF